MSEVCEFEFIFCGLTVLIDYDVVVSTEAPVFPQYGKSLEFYKSD